MYKSELVFTGIVEEVAQVEAVREEGGNRTYVVHSQLDEPVKIDQSIAHNGTCLTVVEILDNDPGKRVRYAVTAVEETLKKTNLGSIAPGDLVNLERCLRAGQRLDGHFVQGHVDTTGEVISVEELHGSWMYRFRFPGDYAGLLVDKGSVCVNGVSLTVIDPDASTFGVTIIPYTHAHTNFKTFKEGTVVNLEFDILGKYLLRQESLKSS